MTGELWPAVLLLAGATVVAWPVRAGRARRRVVLEPAASTPRTRGEGAGRTGREAGRGPVPGTRSMRPAGSLLSVESMRSVGSVLYAGSMRSVRRALPLAVLVAGGLGALLGGPVAAFVLAAYGALAVRAVLRRRHHRAAALAHRRDLDRLAAVAADLRAGLPADGSPADGPGRLAGLARAAGKLADRTGAPLAELLERIEADARATERGLGAAAAQAAGARATAWLLAALPLGGIGLGYGIGVDPVAVLLHTPVGGGSAAAAVALQVGGLLWAERLGVTPGRVA
ncbi:hypothetical protein [Micromonospora sp. DT31]|uniref:hypothetical protein n=1 Tax=Micromonospora sp. DT31 TaxID=3393434 RepID=UPI003CECF752